MFLSSCCGRSPSPNSVACNRTGGIRIAVEQKGEKCFDYCGHEIFCGETRCCTAFASDTLSSEKLNLDILGSNRMRQQRKRGSIVPVCVMRPCAGVLFVQSSVGGDSRFRNNLFSTSHRHSSRQSKLALKGFAARCYLIGQKPAAELNYRLKTGTTVDPCATGGVTHGRPGGRNSGKIDGWDLPKKQIFVSMSDGSPLNLEPTFCRLCLCVAGGRHIHVHNQGTITNKYRRGAMIP